MIVIKCPSCGGKTSISPCGACETDVSPFLGVAGTAERAYAEAWRHASQGRLPEALSRIGVATTLCHDVRYRQLAGWLHFLSGDGRAAMHYWETAPPEACRAADRYNTALALAREGDSEGALEALRAIEVPLQPAQRLENAISGHSGHGESGRREPPGRPALIGVAAVVFLLIGGTIGYGLRDGNSIQNPEVRDPAAQETADAGTEAESPAEDLLRAFLLSEPNLIHERISVDELSESSHGDIEELIPLQVRERAGLLWYRRGYRAFQAGEFEEAERNLHASLASVGLDPGEYWADDALYFLALSLRERGETEKAKTVAGILARTHPGSAYVNSHIGALISNQEESQ